MHGQVLSPSPAARWKRLRHATSCRRLFTTCITLHCAVCLIPACSAAIVSYVKRKIGQGVTTITSSEIEEADALRTGLPALCVAYLPSLEVRDAVVVL